MELIKDTIKNVIQGLADKKAGGAVTDPSLWLKKVLTKAEFGHIKVNYFKKGILSISIDSASQLYALSLKKEILLSGLRRQSTAIKDLRFYIGEKISGKKGQKRN